MNKTKFLLSGAPTVRAATVSTLPAVPGSRPSSSVSARDPYRPGGLGPPRAEAVGRVESAPGAKGGACRLEMAVQCVKEGTARNTGFLVNNVEHRKICKSLVASIVVWTRQRNQGLGFSP